MGKTRKPYPPEFRQQMVELVRAGNVFLVTDSEEALKELVCQCLSRKNMNDKKSPIASPRSMT